MKLFRSVLIVVLVVVVALPLFAMHLYQLWGKPYYRGLPVLLLGIGVLWWRRWPKSPSYRSPSWWGVMAVFAGLVGMIAGAILSWPWLAYIGMMLSAIALLVTLAEPKLRREWLPLWLLLWLLMPLPMNLDQRFIAKSQSAVTSAGSLTLDVLGVGNLREGRQLAVPSHSVTLDAACDAFESPYTLVVLTALAVVALRRPWIWSGLLLASCLPWSIVTNAARTVAVVLLQAKLNCDLSMGQWHAALDVTTLCFALLMIACTDGLLVFLLGPIIPAAPDAELNALSRAWNWCLGWDLSVLLGELD